LGEQFPSLESDGIISNNIIRKPIDVSKLIKKIELELLTKINQKILTSN
jgi:hypothetical protein